MCGGTARRRQLSDGFKSGLADAMDKYATEQNKKDAVDGIQSFVCRLLFLSLVLHNCVWPLRRMRTIYFSVKNKFFFFFFYATYTKEDRAMGKLPVRLTRNLVAVVGDNMIHLILLTAYSMHLYGGIFPSPKIIF